MNPARQAYAEQLIAELGEHVDALLFTVVELTRRHGREQAVADLAAMLQSGERHGPSTVAAIAAIAIGRLADRNAEGEPKCR